MFAPPMLSLLLVIILIIEFVREKKTVDFKEMIILKLEIL